MAKKKNHEHVNHERYLVTYSDLITLLLAFFIILYAMSNVDTEKMEALANALSLAFHTSSTRVLDTVVDGGEDQKNRPATAEERSMMKSVAEQNNLREIKKKIDQKIKEEGLQDSVRTTLNQDGLRIVLTDDILFSSGSSEFKNASNLGLLDYIGLLMGGIANPVRIEGHTDNVPIQTSTYPSNWELSADRSLAVLRYMVQAGGSLTPDRFSATGFGEFKPAWPNDTVEGKAKNRRVEILVERLNGEGLMVSKGGEGEHE